MQQFPVTAYKYQNTAEAAIYFSNHFHYQWIISFFFLLDEKGRHAKSQCTNILEKTYNKDVYFSIEVPSASCCRTAEQIIENIKANEFLLSHDILSDYYRTYACSVPWPSSNCTVIKLFC